MQTPSSIMTTDSTKAAAVDRTYHWLPIDEHTPTGVKLQLIRKDAGAAYYGTYKRSDTFPTHYALLPTFKK
jgi:hypothetical protein